MYRTHNLGELNIKNVGEEVELSGWIQKIRNLGGMVFIDLRDQFGITQIVVNDEKSQEQAKDFTTESCIHICGKVVERSNKNPKMSTGEIEVVANKMEILGKCKNVLPFEINTDQEVREDLRLEYRFLDLRNEKLHNIILLRSKILKTLRDKMDELGFAEIQTPILANSSPEGARDFLVPSRLHPGEFYALPQAPQQFKQLLMVGGFDKYFQIAPCFRDEDPRSDRLYGEFYQLDFEMSFATDEDVYKVGEKVFYDVFTKFSDLEVSKPPFRRIKFKDAILKYGSDKPDLRNPLIIEDITDIMEKTDFAPFKNTVVRCIKVKNLEKSNSWFKSIEEYVKGIHGNLGYIKVSEGLELKSSLAKFMNDDVKKELIERLNLKENDAVFIVADPKRCARIMGSLRTKLGNELNLIDKNKYEFCIINDFPFYEENEETGAIEFSHNPFSMPKGGLDALNNRNPFEIEAYQYDFVCNGYEMASGGVRNHSPEVLKKAFELVGYDEDVVKSKFPSLYEAFKYGAPPHAGMAPGIDRIIMLLKNEENIREIVPFPIGANGADAMMGCPSEAFPIQLKEAHIKIDN